MRNEIKGLTWSERVVELQYSQRGKKIRAKGESVATHTATSSLSGADLLVSAHRGLLPIRCYSWHNESLVCVINANRAVISAQPGRRTIVTLNCILSSVSFIAWHAPYTVIPQRNLGIPWSPTLGAPRTASTIIV